jgi:hypothetical protein
MQHLFYHVNKGVVCMYGYRYFRTAIHRTAAKIGPGGFFGQTLNDSDGGGTAAVLQLRSSPYEQ